MTTELDDLRAELEVEREAGRIARAKAVHQYRENRRLRDRLNRLVTWANARLSLDGGDPEEPPFALRIEHEFSWESLEPGDLLPIGAAAADDGTAA